MTGALATGAYNLGTALIFAHALVPLSPLLWAADRANRTGDALLRHHQRTQQTKDHQ